MIVFLNAIKVAESLLRILKTNTIMSELVAQGFAYVPIEFHP